ncbi:hypothetical protein ACHWQZ_G018280 [Mnemiopsis leidyi]
MEANFASSHDLADEFNNIDCPSWIDFEEENYNPRETDVKWFASAQPHLRTPECIIKAEMLESIQKASTVDISNTPCVKQRRPKTVINDKPPPKLLSGKLQFSSSDEDEISEMLKAHNKRVLNKTGKPTISKEPSAINLEHSEPKAVKEMAKLKVVSQSASNPTIKRRSCAPLLMKNRLVKCNNGLPVSSSLPEKVIESSSKIKPDRIPFKSSISPRSCEIKDVSNSAKLNRNCESSSFEPVPSKIISQPSNTPPEAETFKKSLRRKMSSIAAHENKTGIKSNTSSTVSTSKSESLPPSSKSIAKKCSSQTYSSKALKAPVCKPVIISSSVSKQPNLTNSLQKKVASTSVASKVEPRTKDSLRVKKSNLIQKKVATTSGASKTQSNAKNSLHSENVPLKRDSTRKQPVSKSQSRSTGPFGPSNDVLSIINSKTPGKSRLKASDAKPRYSVETPSPPRTANCESSDDEDLDEFITRQLKAHNAKVEAKMIASTRIAGKAAKTGKQVSLHLGSPSRPKMKPVRHKI